MGSAPVKPMNRLSQIAMGQNRPKMELESVPNSAVTGINESYLSMTYHLKIAMDACLA
jgi:hypothetical protein